MAVEGGMGAGAYRRGVLWGAAPPQGLACRQFRPICRQNHNSVGIFTILSALSQFCRHFRNFVVNFTILSMKHLVKFLVIYFNNKKRAYFLLLFFCFTCENRSENYIYVRTALLWVRVC